MAPNLLVWMLSCIPSRRWVSQSNTPSRSSSSAASYTATEPGKTPVPGIYKRTKNNVWYLTATRDPVTGKKQKLSEHRKVAYCKLLHRWMFADDIEARTRWAMLPQTKSKMRPGDKPVGFFQLDDKVTWVNHLDAHGYFLNASGHARFCLVDKEMGVFRPMLRGDDPVWRASRRSTPRSGLSRRSSGLMTSSAATVRDGASEKGEVQIDPRTLRSELQKLEQVADAHEDAELDTGAKR